MMTDFPYIVDDGKASKSMAFIARAASHCVLCAQVPPLLQSNVAVVFRELNSSSVNLALLFL